MMQECLGQFLRGPCRQVRILADKNIDTLLDDLQQHLWVFHSFNVDVAWAARFGQNFQGFGFDPCCAHFDFPFAFSPSSTRRRLFKTYLRVRTACTVRFSLRAIRSWSILESSNAKSCSSSAGVQGRPVGRGPSFIWLSPSVHPLGA